MKTKPLMEKTHPVWELGHKEEQEAAERPKGHHFPAAGRGRDQSGRDTEPASSHNHPWDQTFLSCRSNSWPDHTTTYLNKN